MMLGMDPILRLSATFGEAGHNLAGRDRGQNASLQWIEVSAALHLALDVFKAIDLALEPHNCYQT